LASRTTARRSSTAEGTGERANARPVRDPATSPVALAGAGSSTTCPGSMLRPLMLPLGGGVAADGTAGGAERGAGGGTWGGRLPSGDGEPGGGQAVDQGG